MRSWKQSPWSWIPSLYIAEGLPFVAVTTIALVMFKRLGMSNAEVTFYSSLIALPWVIKPLWAPFVEAFGTKRKWNLAMELLMAVCFLFIGYTINLKEVTLWSLTAFWILAFCSATHSISSTSLYRINTSSQSRKILDNMCRNFFYLAGLAGTGLMVMLAGGLETYHRNIRHSWSLTFYFLGIIFGAIFVYHLFFLPHEQKEKATPLQLDYRQHWYSFQYSTHSFFHRRGAFMALLFLVFFRLPEALLTKISPLFLLDSTHQGGLGLSTQELGFTSGTVGVLALSLGGYIGAKAVEKKGFNKCFWPMVLLVTVPDILYVILCDWQTQNYGLINLFILLEQFGCGFGFIAYTRFIPFLATNPAKATHRATYAAVMALSLHVPGFIAGLLQEHVGYHNYFLIVLLCCIVTILVSAGVYLTPGYGRK